VLRRCGCGQKVGNHTYSHIDLTQNSVEDFSRDVVQNEPALMLLSSAEDWRWFRYPYLHEGDTIEKRTAVRAFLKDRGYTIAQTTLDYEDYLWNSAYARCSQKQDAKAIAWLRSSYLETAATYLDANRIMAKTVYGREISHVLLLHLGAYSPEILPALFDLLQARGFEFVTLEEAQRDPAYQSDPNFISTNTGTLLEQHFGVKRLKYPPLPAKSRNELAAICM
jgi:peptidoglycan/xylan/chitin deacetylase (PgdA/CDA1 family)